MIILVIIGASLLLIFGVVTYRWIQLNSYNQSPLCIKTFDNLNSPFHPSVVFFHDGWNGWKYWMVETPFSPRCTPYIDRNECPSLHVSNDGINWTTPTNLTNPLVNFGIEGEQNLDYYSDPHLLKTNNRLECFYRLTERHGDINKRDNVSLRRIESVDGINWSDEEIISNLWLEELNIGLGKMVVSPSLIYSDEHGYIMWYVNSEDHSGNRDIALSTSKDGKKWTDAIICTLNGKTLNPWHIDVMKDHDETLLMTIYDKKDISLWKSDDGFNWEYINTILSPSAIIGSFYSDGLYRSCLIHDSENYKLYFSAYNFNKTSIGLCTFNILGDNPTIVSHGRNCSFLQFIILYFEYEYRHIAFVLKNIFNKILSCVSFGFR